MSATSIRQLDIPASLPGFHTIPKWAPGRLGVIDFVFFVWPQNLDASRYQVIVEVLDMSSNDPYRSISKLNDTVELPHIQYGWNSKILVLPDSEDLPRFKSVLSRGATYKIPNVTRPGLYDMELLGSLRPSGR